MPSPIILRSPVPAPSLPHAHFDPETGVELSAASNYAAFWAPDPSKSLSTLQGRRFAYSNGGPAYGSDSSNRTLSFFDGAKRPRFDLTVSTPEMLDLSEGFGILMAVYLYDSNPAGGATIATFRNTYVGSQMEFRQASSGRIDVHYQSSGKVGHTLGHSFNRTAKWQVVGARFYKDEAGTSMVDWPKPGQGMGSATSTSGRPTDWQPTGKSLLIGNTATRFALGDVVLWGGGAPTADQFASYRDALNAKWATS